MIDSSNFALAQAFEQAGVKLKAAVFATGYDPSLVDIQPGAASKVTSSCRSTDHSLLRMRARCRWRLRSRSTNTLRKPKFPTLFQYETWAGADLMIKGIQLAGANPTRAGVIKALRSINNYTANGLLPEPVDYSTNFGHDPAKQCVWVLRAAKAGFVPASSKPVCGSDIKGTASGTAAS